MSESTVAIKMCGLRLVADIDAACDAGADMLGIVLVPGVRREVDIATALKMVERARERSASVDVVAVVGGLMSPASIVDIVTQLGVDAVQLVGDDAAAAIASKRIARSISVIRALAVDPVDSDAIYAVLTQAASWEQSGARVVFEPRVTGSLGGAGVALAPNVSRRLFDGAGRGLAGGLTPENVAELIRDITPAFVDVSSGIEIDGHKDPATMRRFAEAVRGSNL